jgi:hypothetical protein
MQEDADEQYGLLANRTTRVQSSSTSIKKKTISTYRMQFDANECIVN